MDILNQFGFDPKLFLAQIINFLVIAYVFKRFMYKPILETIKKRDNAIKKGLKDAELAAKALENAEAQQNVLLKKAGLEAERILEESKAQAQNVREEMVENTKKELARMMDQTKEQISLERDNFKKEAKDVSLEIAREVLQATVSQLFDKKEQDIVLKKGIQKLKNEKPAKN